MKLYKRNGDIIKCSVEEYKQIKGFEEVIRIKAIEESIKKDIENIREFGKHLKRKTKDTKNIPKEFKKLVKKPTEDKPKRINKKQNIKTETEIVKWLTEKPKKRKHRGPKPSPEFQAKLIKIAREVIDKKLPISRVAKRILKRQPGGSDWRKIKETIKRLSGKDHKNKVNNKKRWSTKSKKKVDLRSVRMKFMTKRAKEIRTENPRLGQKRARQIASKEWDNKKK